jgi:hypothetical protein
VTPPAVPADFLSFDRLVIGGAVGGLAAFVLTMGLPYLREVAEGRITEGPSRFQFVAVLIIAAFHMFMGGIAAAIVGDASKMGQAITFGLAWPAVLKGAGESMQAIAAARTRGPRQPGRK